MDQSFDPEHGPAPPAGSGNWRRLRGALLEYAGLAIVLTVLILFFGWRTNQFFSQSTTIANQIPAALIVAVAMTFVLIAGEIDLSVGSVLGLSGAVLGLLMSHYHWHLPAALLGCLLVGLLCGVANGWVTTAFKLPSFIVTLGMLEIARGSGYWVAQSQTQYIGSAIAPIASISLFGLSLPFLVAISLVILGQLLLMRTVFGRYVIAVGTNAEATRLSGIDPRRIKFAVLALSGLLVAIAAIIDTSRFGPG